MPLWSQQESTAAAESLRHAEGERRRGVTTQEAVLDALPAHIALLDSHGVIASVNRAWKRFAAENDGGSSALGVGQNYADLCDAAVGDDTQGADLAARGIRSVLAGEVPECSLEYPCHSKKEQRWYRMTVTALRAEAAGGLTDGAIVMHVDITERKHAEFAARRTNDLLQAVADGTPDQVFVKDIQGRYLLCNQALARFFGRSVEQLIGHDNTDLLGPADAMAPIESDHRVIASGQVQTSEYTLTATGGTRTFLSTKAPYRDERGDVIGVIGISRDITERKQQEVERERERGLLRTLIDALPDAVYTMDAAARYVICNPAMVAASGVTGPQELLGKTVSEVFALETGQSFLADDLRVLAGHAVWNREDLDVDSRGEPRWHLTTKLPLRDGSGRIVGLVGMHRNITQQKSAQAQTRQLADRLGTTLASLTDGFYTLDLAWRYTYANAEAERLLGLPLAHRLGRVIWDEFAGLQSMVIGQALLRAAQAGTVVQFLEHYTPMGRWLDVRIYPSSQGVAVYFRDVSEQQTMAMALAQERAHLVAAQAVAKLGNWSLDPVTQATTWSQEMHTILQTDPQQVLPSYERFIERVHPEDLATVRGFYAAPLEPGAAGVLEHRLLLPDGEVKTVEERWEVFVDGQGGPARVLGTMQDITARRRAEEETRRLALRLTNTLESIADGFFTVDRDWRFTHVNGRAERMAGRTREELIGRELWREFPLLVGTAFEHAYRRAMNEGIASTAEAYFAAWNGWFSAKAYSTDEGLTVYFRDVTAERATRQQLLLLEASVSQLNDMVMITDAPASGEPGPRILFVNDAFVRISGYARDELVGQSPHLLHGPLTDRAELERIGTRRAAREPVHAELLDYKKSGEPYWLEIDIVPVSVQGEHTSHFVNVARDITERKRHQDALRDLNAELEARVLARTAELNLAREEAEQANRAKSAFLATMSHEIRTPMNGVMGMIDVLHQTSLKGYQVEMVDLIRDSADTLLAIIDDILDFSKIEAGKLQIEQEPMQLADAVEKVCAMVDHMAVKRNVHMTVFVDPAIPRLVAGDETRVRQVLVNLCSNAIKFSSGRAHAGQVSVRAVLVERGAPVTVDLIVTDNGIGIDEATLARLFTPFSQADGSTTRRFGGTGLGLAICSTLVRLMGGELSVRSAPGQGSTFTVRLRLGPVEAVADSVHEDGLTAAEGLRCRIVGAEQPLAADLGAYLKHAGAHVVHSPDLAAAAAAAPQAGLCVWLILPGQLVPDLTALRAMGPNSSDAQTRFVVLGRGARRRPRVVALDLITIDADVLFRRTLVKVLAMASGGAPLEPSADTKNPLGPLPILPRHEARLQGRLILVAEDNETNRHVILRQLELLGFAADVVVNGREALASWRSGDYALLLTDLHMPEMDGYALAAAIRAEEAGGRRKPILALTANALRDEELRCLGVGIDAYLTKPIRLPQLRSAIETWLAPSVPMPTPTPVRGGQGGESESAAPAPPVDLNVLVALVGDDPAVIADVLHSFRKSASRLGEELRQGGATGSKGAVKAAAHKLKSGARSIGAARLGEVCGDIERGCADPALGALLLRFEIELSAVWEFLDQREVMP